MDDIEWQRFIDRYYKLESAIEDASKCPELKAKNPYPHNIWILKPGENTNKGNGISVCENIHQIKSTIAEEKLKNAQRTFILQKYIERPLLYRKRKFDIRAYMLITSINK